MIKVGKLRRTVISAFFSGGDIDFAKSSQRLAVRKSISSCFAIPLAGNKCSGRYVASVVTYMHTYVHTETSGLRENIKKFIDTRAEVSETRAIRSQLGRSCDIDARYRTRVNGERKKKKRGNRFVLPFDRKNSSRMNLGRLYSIRRGEDSAERASDAPLRNAERIRRERDTG